MNKPWKRELARASTGIVVLVVLLVGFPLLARDSLIYFPGNDVPPPAAVGLPGAEAMTITSRDGIDLQAWYVPANGEAVGGVLVLHANAGDRADRAPLAARLRSMGLATLLLDYRGFGGSEGRPNQAGLLSDSRAALDALRRRSGLDNERIVYFGESLGSAVAAWLAARQPPAAVVMRSPFTNITAVGRRRYPWLPVDRLLRDRYPTAKWISGYDGATLVVAGDSDRIIPVEFSRQVVEAARGDARLLLIEEAGHNSRALLDGDQMRTGITSFLRKQADLPVRRAAPVQGSS